MRAVRPQHRDLVLRPGRRVDALAPRRQPRIDVGVGRADADADRTGLGDAVAEIEIKNV